MFEPTTILVPALATSFNASVRTKKNKKHESTTMAIRNAGFTTKLKVNEY
jgi:hypothetical protein